MLTRGTALSIQNALSSLRLAWQHVVQRLRFLRGGTASGCGSADLGGTGNDGADTRSAEMLARCHKGNPGHFAHLRNLTGHLDVRSTVVPEKSFDKIQP